MEVLKNNLVASALPNVDAWSEKLPFIIFNNIKLITIYKFGLANINIFLEKSDTLLSQLNPKFLTNLMHLFFESFNETIDESIPKKWKLNNRNCKSIINLKTMREQLILRTSKHTFKPKLTTKCRLNAFKTRFQMEIIITRKKGAW